MTAVDVSFDGQTDLESLGTEEASQRLSEVDDLIHRCDLSKEMQVCIGYYIMMEEYYMRQMATKVTPITHQLPYSLRIRTPCTNVEESSVSSFFERFSVHANIYSVL
mgnify:CR=1 FL=1